MVYPHTHYRGVTDRIAIAISKLFPQHISYTGAIQFVYINKSERTLKESTEHIKGG